MIGTIKRRYPDQFVILSSPKDGWGSSNPGKHHDYININDFPKEWLSLDITVEVEAKAKELAIKKLMQDIKSSLIGPSCPTND